MCYYNLTTEFIKITHLIFILLNLPANFDFQKCTNINFTILRYVLMVSNHYFSHGRDKDTQIIKKFTISDEPYKIYSYFFIIFLHHVLLLHLGHFR